MAGSMYQKTSAKWQGMLTGASLWLAEDHILSVRNMRFSEEYKRYYYHEMQALQLRPAPRFWCPSWLAVLLIVLAVCALIFSFSLRGVGIVCGACLVALAGYAAYRSLRSCCVCHVVTAVSTDAIPALKTIKSSRKVISLIARRAALAQGELTENWLTLLDEELSNAPAAKKSPAMPIDSGRDRMGVAAALAALIGTFFDGVITIAQVNRWHVPEWLGMTNALLAVAAAVIMVMLLRSHRYLWLRNIALAAVLFLGLLTYSSYMIGNFQKALAGLGGPGLALAGGVLSYVNIAGDFCLLIAALVLWVRWSAGANAVGEA
jgi:hypothetical protein